ncbi:ActS/PrrB/RegB family redox-sensitive histidine kinase [Rhodobacterales bacterium HKCCE2091]|nr:ActS/PrrB/RegB family redox-sensitive histidine kinase [Rhodobacterales bacterium HKCCE2091]
MAVTERPTADIAAGPETGDDLLIRETWNDWVRLRTLLVLRWLAILGQTVAVVIASFYLGLRVELGLCFLAIGASVLSNLVAMAVFPENHRLSDRDAMLTLLFDMAQLSFLLFLTGGLDNPFALLILAPVTISATALTMRSTLLLGATAIAMITALLFWNLPLTTAEGDTLELPEMFAAGFWCAIVIGIIFLSAYARRVALEGHTMSLALAATQMALAREQKLTDLGGVVAAAAHELGTPLATIKLVTTELFDELGDRDDLREDLTLIRDQADRCRDILRSMGRAGKDDKHMRLAPLGEVLREAAEPHSDRGIEILFQLEPAEGASPEQPVIHRKPEVIHGLRNLIQNAVDFARSRVWVEARWRGDRIAIRIVDDGAGFPPELLGRLGDPFLRRRRGEAGADRARPGYDGMGLGLFIAKTLLERTGARVSFANAADPFLAMEDRGDKSGAMVEVDWPWSEIARDPTAAAAPLGDNQPFPI